MCCKKPTKAALQHQYLYLIWYHDLAEPFHSLSTYSDNNDQQLTNSINMAKNIVCVRACVCVCMCVCVGGQPWPHLPINMNINDLDYITYLQFNEPIKATELCAFRQ